VRLKVAPPSVERIRPTSVATSTTSVGPDVSTFRSRTAVALGRLTNGLQVWPPSTDFTSTPATVDSTSNGSPMPR